MAIDAATFSVLIVDPDDGFVDETKDLLDGHKSYTARNINDAQRRLVEEGIDLAVVGPSYAHESGNRRGEPAFRRTAEPAGPPGCRGRRPGRVARRPLDGHQRCARYAAHRCPKLTKRRH